MSQLEQSVALSDNETPLVNCTEMYADYELDQIVCEYIELIFSHKCL